MTNFITNISGDVEKLLTIGKLNGNIINNGTIYLTTSFEVFKKLESVDLSQQEFEVLALTYFKSLHDQYGKVKIVGYPERLSFDEFYILPIFKRCEFAGYSNDVDLEAVYNIHQLLKITDYIYLNGPAGSGKTILLKYILSQIEELNILAVPIFITLSSFKSFCIVNRQFSLYDYICKEFNSYGFPLQFVKFILKNKLALILMDGLDEIYVKENEKSIIYNQIEDFNKLYWAKILITSRCLDFDYSNPVKMHFQIMPFSREQIHEYLAKTLSPPSKIDFLRKLNQMHNFTFEDRNSKDNIEQDWAMDRVMTMVNAHLLPSEVGDVILNDKPLPQIASTPLLLSLLVLNYLDNNIVPTGKNSVFRSIIVFLMNKWLHSENSEFFRNVFTSEDAMSMLNYIGFITLADGGTLVSRIKLFSIISEYLKLKNLNHLITAGDILKTFKTDLGVIADYGADEYIFIHPILQKYLAGQYLSQDENYNMIFSKQLFLKSNWSDVLVMLTESIGTDARYLKSYSGAVIAVSQYSAEVRQRIEYATKKAKVPDGPVSLCLFFYHICITLLFGSGGRARYACMRIAHRILSNIYSHQTVHRFTLHRFTSEVTKISEDYNLDELFVDSWILQIYDIYTESKREYEFKIEEIIDKVSSYGGKNLTADLLNFEKARDKGEKDEAIQILQYILKKRGLVTHEILFADDLNILTTFVDLIEIYLVAVPKREMMCAFLNSILGDAQTDYKLDHPIFSDYLTSSDYSHLSDYVVDMHQCLEYCDKAININPGHAHFYFARGATRHQFEKYSEGLKDFHTALSLDPTYENRPDFQVCIAISYCRNGDYDSALLHFNRSIEINIESNENQVAGRWFKAELFIQRKAFELAKQSLEEMAQYSNTLNSLYYYTLAYCYLQLNKFEKAMHILKSLVEICYSYKETLFMYALCMVESGMYQQCITLLRQKGQALEVSDHIFDILLLKSYKMLNLMDDYHGLLDTMRQQKIITKKNGLIKIGLAPTDFKTKLFDQELFIDLEIHYNLTKERIFKKNNLFS